MARERVTATVDVDHAERQLLESVSLPGFGPVASNGLLAVRALRVRLAAERTQKIRLAARVVQAVCGLGLEPLTAREVNSLAEELRRLALRARDNRLAAQGDDDGG